MKRKNGSLDLSKEKWWKSRGTHYGSQKNCKVLLVKVLDAASKCTKSISRHQTYRNLHQTATHLNDLQKQGSSANQLQCKDACCNTRILARKKLLPALWYQTLRQSQFWHPAHQPSSRNCSHWALQVLDYWHWSHEAPRKRHRISLRRPYTPRSVHCHRSLHLHCRRKMQRHAHPWAFRHSSKGFWKGKVQRLTWQYPPTPIKSCCSPDCQCCQGTRWQETYRILHQNS